MLGIGPLQYGTQYYTALCGVSMSYGTCEFYIVLFVN